MAQGQSVKDGLLQPFSPNPVCLAEKQALATTLYSPEESFPTLAQSERKGIAKISLNSLSVSQWQRISVRINEP